MDKTPDDSSNPAAAAWESLRVVLEAHTVEFDVDALAAPAMAVGLHTTPICAFIIGKDGDIEIQVARAVVEWFPQSDLKTVIQRTVPELLDAVRTRSIKNEVVRDSDGFIAQAKTWFAAKPPVGLNRVYEATYAKRARRKD